MARIFYDFSGLKIKLIKNHELHLLFFQPSRKDIVHMEQDRLRTFSRAAQILVEHCLSRKDIDHAVRTLFKP